jgi:hypothetical protein
MGMVNVGSRFYIPTRQHPRSFRNPFLCLTPARHYGEKMYEGTEAIVVAMDIGMTHSKRDLSGWASLIRFLGAASFAHFSPGSKPQVKMVFCDHDCYVLSHLEVRLLIGPARPIGATPPRWEIHS